MIFKHIFRRFRIFCIRWLTAFARPISVADCVILAPHPDDETLGCGEYIASARRQSKRVEVVFLSSGSRSHAGCCDISQAALAKAREADALKALAVLGVSAKNVHFLRLPDGGLAKAIPEHKQAIVKLLESLGIKTLLVPHPREGWADHEAVSSLGDELQTQDYCRLYYCIWFYFSMPFRKFYKVSWRSVRAIKDSSGWQQKRQAAKLYFTDCAPCGKPYAGVLPDELQKAVLNFKEIYF